MATDIDIQAFRTMLGERVRMRRKALGLTQEKLAEAANLSPTHIAKLETGKKMPSVETILEIASALNIDAGDLIRRTENAEDSNAARSVANAFAGLSEKDVEFVREQLLQLISFLRKR